MRIAVLTAWLAACGPAVPHVDPEGEPPERLSQLGLVRWDGADVTYDASAFPYTLATPLFSDHATKRRALWLPEGTTATVAGDGVIALPVGSAILKTFLMPADLRRPDDDLTILETRVLVRAEAGWQAWPYRWDDDGRDATLALGGDVVDVSVRDGDGGTLSFAYVVPQRNQCAECHEQKDAEGRRHVVPIGPKPRHLDVDGQLEALVDAGLLADDPALDAVAPSFPWSEVVARGVDGLGADEVEPAARSYLDVNCAHCHSRTAVNGITSQLFLDRAETDPFHLGVCKRPGSAGKGGVGRTHDVVPGDPEASILHYRMVTEDLGAIMPDLGRSVVHEDGAALIARWIAAMEPVGCDE